MTKDDILSAAPQSTPDNSSKDVTSASDSSPIVGIIMGSQSDWDTMQHASIILHNFGIAHEVKIVSAHRTPDRLYEYAKTSVARGLKVIIAGAGGAAHLPGMAASMTRLPVLGVPVQSKALDGMDSLLSIVQMPAGVPVATLAIGVPGAKNAALLAVSILASHDHIMGQKLDEWRTQQSNNIVENVNTDGAPL